MCRILEQHTMALFDSSNKHLSSTSITIRGNGITEFEIIKGLGLPDDLVSEPGTPRSFVNGIPFYSVAESERLKPSLSILSVQRPSSKTVLRLFPRLTQIAEEHGNFSVIDAVASVGNANALKPLKPVQLKFYGHAISPSIEAIPDQLRESL